MPQEGKAKSYRTIAVLIFFMSVAVYLSNGKSYPASDTIAARYLPFSILREGDFDLDEFRNLQVRSLQSGVVYTGTHYVSAYPVGASIVAIPIFLPAAISGIPANSRTARHVEKAAASSIVALSASILYLALLLITDRNRALLITAVYAFGTSSFSVCSQALWQHGSSQLSLIAALYCLIRGMKSPRWIAFSGFFLSFSVLCRPTNVFLFLAAALFVLIHYRKSLLLFVIAAMPPAIFLLLYNYIYFENPFRTQWPVNDPILWSIPILEGAAGILFSPARGLLIYSPVLVFSFLAAALFWRKSEKQKDVEGYQVVVLFRYLSIGLLMTFILYSKYFMWWGGYTYGPRLLADLTPVLCLFIALLPPLRKVARIVFAILAVWSIFAHSIGAYVGDLRWNSDMQIDTNPKARWLWTNNQLVNPVQRIYNRIFSQDNDGPPPD